MSHPAAGAQRPEPRREAGPADRRAGNGRVAATGGRRAHRLALLAILALALALRLGHWWAVKDDPFIARLAMDSWEYDRWAREVSAGAWLADEPFFQAPLYPYLLAVVYRVFGHHLNLVYLLQVALAVAGCWALYRAGRRLAGEAAGLAAAGLAAVYGPFLFYDVQLLKESLAVTTAAFLLWCLAAARAAARGSPAAPGSERQGGEPAAAATPQGERRVAAGGERAGPGGWRLWLAAGLLAGVLALLRENMLLVFPALLLLALGRGVGWRRAAARGAWMVAGLAVTLLPAALHNAHAGGGFLPTTFQGGVNFYIGNNPRADGTYRPITPGKQVPFFERREPVRIAEAEAGRELTAAQVSRHWLGKSLAWARREPGAFLALQVRKLGLFLRWYEQPDAVDYYYLRQRSPILGLPLVSFGAVSLLAVWGLWRVRRRPGPWAPAILFAAAWTASTVVFFIFSRYRLPAVPALLLLAALPVAELARALRRRRWRRAALVGAGVLAAWLAPQALGYQPRWDLVHYNLGRLYEEAGEAQQAARHYRQALAANPEDFLSHLNLGNQAARAGRYEEARRHFERAVAIEPAFDDAWANLGGAEMALGNPGAAAVALDRALELNPESPNALHNRAVLLLRQGDVEGARRLNRRLLELEPDHPAARRLAERLAGLGRDRAPPR